ncbi:ABC transporter permease [Exiguobacterium sp.]|uniref:ABC transporter permease n=1 Tax=Exiguobacterium sp. TaxID=44751 RepID=UPI00263AEF9A|nr:ABC transporter permease [Exiguobacterium sp.]MCC5893258.1 ABC transporter permease [Exiguobacterium sp.]
MKRILFLIVLLLPFIGLFSSMPAPLVFDEAVANTIVHVFVLAGLNVWLALGTAWWLLFTESRWRPFVEWFLFLPLFVPALASTFGMYVALVRFGLVGTQFGVLTVLLAVTLPYSIRIAYNAMYVIGRPLFEQALFLPPVRRVQFVLVPLLTETVRTIALMSTVVVLGQFVLVQLIGAGLVPTVTTRLYHVYAGNDVSLALQNTWLLVLIPALLYGGIGYLMRIWMKVMKGRLR